MRRIAVVNQKGGVGKTTTSANISHALALAGQRVLMIDMDPQSHLASFFGQYEQGRGLDAVLMDGDDLDAHIQTIRPKLSLLAAGKHLAGIEHEASSEKRGGALRQLLAKRDDWDFIIMDSPPSSGLLVIMAMYAADEILIPVTGDYMGMEGLSHLMATLKNFESSLNHHPKRWLALTRFHPRRNIAKEAQKKLKHYFPKHVLATPIREIAALSACPGFGKSIFEYQASSQGAEDYRDLAADLMAGRILS
ncbi:MAG: ParA family protein [Zetaproteobacteria bacterium]|nr:ParA family protein [Zetaproteobacteria bacterium]